MRVATVDGLVILLYDGSKELYNDRLDFELLTTGIEHGRRLIQGQAIFEAMDLSDECKRIEICAFFQCTALVFIKWSISLEYIGKDAFHDCDLSSVFIPPRCREICECAFTSNGHLTIFHVPQDTEIGRNIVDNTALAEASPFEVLSDSDGSDVLEERADPTMNTWLKNMNNDEAFALHRACSSFQPLKEVIHAIIQEKGLKAFREENNAGITPSQYLKENPNNTLTEKEIIHDYLMKMMGEFE